MWQSNEIRIICQVDVNESQFERKNLMTNDNEDYWYCIEKEIEFLMLKQKKSSWRGNKHLIMWYEKDNDIFNYD